MKTKNRIVEYDITPMTTSSHCKLTCGRNLVLVILVKGTSGVANLIIGTKPKYGWKRNSELVFMLTIKEKTPETSEIRQNNFCSCIAY